MGFWKEVSGTTIIILTSSFFFAIALTTILQIQLRDLINYAEVWTGGNTADTDELFGSSTFLLAAPFAVEEEFGTKLLIMGFFSWILACLVGGKITTNNSTTVAVSAGISILFTSFLLGYIAFGASFEILSVVLKCYGNGGAVFTTVVAGIAGGYFGRERT
ncbi:MAG: hypothetical protein Q6356_000860 [Candidatus Wukongarchaeota archaeon]|nr:hypothetical protein [Candidatus Wukongarchaeota archaeon]